jgi:aspartokinase/homoserine dehydrogenase 1
VAQSGIPVWIRNTFAPEKSGTKITPRGHDIDGGVTALSSISDVTLITVTRTPEAKVPELIERILAALAGDRSEPLMVSYLPAQAAVCVAISTASAKSARAGLSEEIALHLNPTVGCQAVTVDDAHSILTVVGQNLVAVKGIVKLTIDKLEKENISVLATGQALSGCNVSFIVPRKDLETALLIAHHELKRDVPAYRLATDLLHRSSDETLRTAASNS